MDTVAVPLNDSEPGLITGVCTCVGGGVLEDRVQVFMFWMAVFAPVPPVKPTKAVFPPTVCGMFTGQLVVNVAFAVLSVMVMVRVVPL